MSKETLKTPAWVDQAIFWDEAARADPIFAAINVPESAHVPDASVHVDHFGGLLLDVGCGWGRTLAPIGRSADGAVGLDISGRMLHLAREYCKGLGVIPALARGEASLLPFKSETFDRVYSVLMLMHLSKAQAAKCMEEMARVLKAGGRAVFNLPNVLTEVGLLSIAMQTLGKVVGRSGPARIRFYTSREIETLVHKHYRDFQISATGFHPMHIFPNSRFRWFDPAKGRFARVSKWLEQRANKSSDEPLRLFCKNFYVTATK